MENNHILFAAGIGKDCLKRQLLDDEVCQAIRDRTKVWVHLDALNPNTEKWLKSELKEVDPIVRGALLAGETRPRVLESGKGVLLILRGVNLNVNADPEDMVSIRLWIDEHRIISAQRRNLKAVKDIQQQCLNGKGPVDIGDFVVRMTGRLFERMEPVMAELDERTDDIEELILENPSVEERQQIVDIRKQAIILRRYIIPQRDVMNFLRNCDQPWMSSIQKQHIQENLDRITRYVEDLDAIRERAQIVKDELANMLADRMNKNMYQLSVVAAIFLPLGFLTGLFGINLAGIPGAEYPYAFTIFAIILAVIVGGQIVVMKKLKWF